MANALIDIMRYSASRLIGRQAVKSNNYWTSGLWPLWGGGTGTAGRNRDLTHDKYGAALAYMLVEPVYRSVNWISDNIGRMKWRLVDLDSDEPIDTSESADPTHPFALALKRSEQESNRSDGIFKLWAANLLLYGENPLEIVRNRADYVYRFKWLNALGVQINAPSGIIMGYFYSGAGGSTVFAPDEIAYDFVLNPMDDVRGYSPTLNAIQAANIELNSNRTWSAYYRNGARPDMLIAPEQGTHNGEGVFSTEDISIIETSWRNTFQGSANAFRAGIIPILAKFLPFEQPDLSKHIPLSEHTVRSIYRRYGVPLTLAGDTAAGPYQGNNDAVLEGAFETALKPHSDGIAKFVNLRLLPLFSDAKRVRFEFDYSDYDFIGENEKNRTEVVARQVETGMLDLYDAQTALGNQKPDQRLRGLYMINGTPVPIDAMHGLWERTYQATPAAVGPGMPSEPTTPLIDVTPAPARLPSGQPAPVIEAGTNEQAPENIESTQGLNGAQITAALEILNGVTTGGTAPDVAKELLMALGLASERANTMVDETVGNRSSAAATNNGDEAATKALAWRDEARTELSAWQKFALGGKLKARPFEPEATRGDLADTLQAALEVAETSETIKSAFDAAFGRLAVKAIDRTRGQFEEAFTELLTQARGGDVTRAQFSARMRQLLIRYGFQAYADGLRDGGVDDDPDEDETGEIDRILSEQGQYISGLAKVLYKEDGVTDAEADIKGTLWVNRSVMPFYNAGLLSSAANQLMEFGGDDGDESCRTCTAVKGERHRLKDWHKHKLVPHDYPDSFECGSWQCKHRLFAAKGKPRGNYGKGKP